MSAARATAFGRRSSLPPTAVSSRARRQCCVARSSTTAASWEVLGDALAVYKSAPEQMVSPPPAGHLSSVSFVWDTQDLSNCDTFHNPHAIA